MARWDLRAAKRERRDKRGSMRMRIRAWGSIDMILVGWFDECQSIVEEREIWRRLCKGY